MKNLATTRPDPVAPSYLAHELRAPVTAIRLGLELLKEDAETRLPSESRSLLAAAVKNTARLEGLIDDILDFAKLSSGRMPLEKSDCGPRDLALEAVESVGAWARSAGVELGVETSEPLPRMWTDGRRVVQVLTNLLSNALKFTPRGGSIRLRVRRELSGAVRFQVQDTGCGIPACELEEIFEAFAQASEGRKISQGTGLGLTLSRLLIEQLGGRIWAESAPGHGASFFFTIPAAG